MLLQAKALAHRFERVLYEDLDLTLARGESVAIVGVSGSGKSTILNNLSTMLKPSHGQVDILDSKDIYSLSQNALLNLRREKIGIIFQAHYLFRGFSVKENLQIATILSKQELDLALLERFNIAQTLSQNIGELSGGQQQRLSIARILTKKPQIIFADEPTGNLDSQTARNVMECVLEYVKSARAGLIIATHDMQIAQMCDRILQLHEGKLTTI